MAKYLYKKKRNKKLFVRLFSVALVLIGGGIFIYTFFPLLSWQIYFAPAFANSSIDSPIPSHSMNPTSLTSLIGNATNNLNTDYTNAYNWYPGYQVNNKNIINYTISIPKI
jgi:hypothetical protein